MTSERELLTRPCGVGRSVQVTKLLGLNPGRSGCSRLRLFSAGRAFFGAEPQSGWHPDMWVLGFRFLDSARTHSANVFRKLVAIRGDDWNGIGVVSSEFVFNMLNHESVDKKNLVGRQRGGGRGCLFLSVSPLGACASPCA